MKRPDQRQANELRPLTFQMGFQSHPAGSVLISCGGTRVLCSVTVEESVPGWMRAEGKKGGWVTAEYSMLPSATHSRTRREVTRGKQGGRTLEIQRLIGRSLRCMVDLEKLGPRTLTVDCDVIDADGGTRCASITGSAVALKLAVQKLLDSGLLTESPIKEMVAAVSVGVVDGELLLDLCYEEDSAAGVDMNVVMTEAGEFVEIQGTGEEHSFTFEQMTGLAKLAEGGLKQIFEQQQAAF